MAVEVTDPAWDFDLTDVGLAPHMYEVFAELRARCPVTHSQKYGGFAAVLSYEGVRQAALDHQTFTSTRGTAIPSVTGNLATPPTDCDPPDHGKYRKLIQKYFTRRAIAVHEPWMREVVRGRITELATAGAADLVSGIARVLPGLTIAKILGLPQGDLATVMGLSNDLFVTVTKGDLVGHQKVVDTYVAYIAKEVARQRAAGADTLITAIADGRIDDRPLNDDEQLGMLLLLVSAGLETTVNSIGTMLYYVATVDGLRERLIDDAALIPKMIDECLRIQSPVTSSGRVAQHDTTLVGQELPDSQRLLIVYGAANRDPAVFERPDEFVCPRDRNPHLAFGFGIHRCIGEHLALLEMRVVIEEMLALVPDYQVAADFEPEWVAGRLTRGMARLPAVFPA